MKISTILFLSSVLNGESLDSDLNVNLKPGIEETLFVRFHPSPACDVSDDILLKPFEYATLSSHENSDFVPSWIGDHATVFIPKDDAKIWKLSLLSLYNLNKAKCDDSLVEWRLGSIYTTVPMSIVANPVLRLKSPVELFTIMTSEGQGGLRLHSIKYSRASPTTIRALQVGTLERRAMLSSPYVVVDSQPSKHKHFLKPISNGWTTTPAQIQDEKEARKKLVNSEHEHLPAFTLSHYKQSFWWLREKQGLLFSGIENVYFAKEGNTLRQKKMLKEENSDAVSTTQGGVMAFVQRNWMYILISWMVLNLFFSDGEKETANNEPRSVETAK
eukprot:GHVH01004370.1.p1 GENE.GHVH01004370.1~~GHVH01004370.1.p1  ORF type:complete len:330 (-),score=46.05 GHVH01004370.1:35-1024(-)